MMIFFSGPNDKITSRYAKGGDVSYGLSMTIDARKGSREQTCFQTLMEGRQRRSRDHIVPGECSIWWPATAKARQPTAGRPTQFDGRRQTAPADDWSEHNGGNDWVGRRHEPVDRVLLDRLQYHIALTRSPSLPSLRSRQFRQTHTYPGPAP